jgi:DNA replication protein DnaC
MAIYNNVSTHFNATAVPPLAALVLGSAGTGKSFLIHSLRHLLNACCAVLAPTGVAAVNISGSTIHSYFQFAKVQDLRPLRGPALQRLQDKCVNLRYLLVDELSMIGCCLIHTRDHRLR